MTWRDPSQSSRTGVDASPSRRQSDSLSKALRLDGVPHAPPDGQWVIPGLWMTVSSTNPVAHRMHIVPWYLREARMLTGLGMHTPNGLALSFSRLGVYPSHPTTGRPSGAPRLSVQLGTQSPGVRTVDVGERLEPGVWWLASASQGVFAGFEDLTVGMPLTDALSASDPGGLLPNTTHWYVNGVEGALPSLNDSMLVQSNSVAVTARAPVIYVRTEK